MNAFAGFILLVSLLLVGCQTNPGLESARKNFDIQKALAEQGSAEAQFNLGKIYAAGFATSRNQDLACQWWEKSAKQGNADAKYALYQCYKVSNPTKARSILLQFGQAGNSYALSTIKDEIGKDAQSLNLDEVLILAQHNVANKSDLDLVYESLNSDPSYTANFRKNQVNDVTIYLSQKDQAEKNHISLAEQLKNYKTQQLSKEVEANKRQEAERQKELQLKAEQDRAATQARANQDRAAEIEKTKAYEQEKNSWYSYKKFLNTYVCDQSGSGDGNPGTMLSYAKNYEDPSAHAENEIKEGNQIIAVDIVLPRKGGVIRYVRGKQRCEAIIKRLNTQIQSEDKALKDKYK